MVFYILLVRKNCENILTRLLICDKISRILGLKGVKNMSKTVVRKNESLIICLQASRGFQQATLLELEQEFLPQQLLLFYQGFVLFQQP